MKALLCITIITAVYCAVIAYRAAREKELYPHIMHKVTLKLKEAQDAESIAARFNSADEAELVFTVLKDVNFEKPVEIGLHQNGKVNEHLIVNPKD